MVQTGLNKDDVINVVIVQAKNEFSEHEQHYIQITRLNKLITLVVEELSKENYNVEDFIWGYYRHGFYSKSANTYLKDNFGEGFDLSQINASAAAELPENVTEIVSECINGIKDIFIKSREEFYDWVYQKKTPTRYQDFYQSHRLLEKWFENMKITGHNVQCSAVNKIFDIISDYYFSLNHVEDPVTIDIFGRFSDMLEQLSLKMKNGDNSTVSIELERLHFLYKKKIYSIMTPYLETVQGDDALIEDEIKSHKKRMFHLKSSLKQELKSLQMELESKDMFPQMDDLHEEIRLAAGSLEDITCSIQEIYEDLG